MKRDTTTGSNSVPTIVRVILTQATRHRAQGMITDAVFEEQVRRITREELTPRALSLLVRDLADGRTRFIIRNEVTGAVCDMLDLTADGTLETESADAVAALSEDSPPASGAPVS